MKKRIAYISHVPWGDIKQRPQFIAEQLAKDFVVDYIEQKGVRSFVKPKNVTPLPLSNIGNLRIIRVPYINNHKIIQGLKWIARIINYLCIKLFISIKNFDCIWITHPSMYEQYKSHLNFNRILIYDCMDDALEFENYEMSRDQLYKIEKELITKSDIVFCSAEYLRQKLVTRYKARSKIVVVNNAVELPKIELNNSLLPDYIQKIVSKVETMHFPMVYIGAVSSWFDFELVLKLLEQHTQISLVLIGPKDVQVPVHERILYYSPVQRDYIFNIMDKAAALVMPFRVNELIKSVNPVKLYEYIYMGKPVIAPRYGESLKFEDYVYLYDDYTGFSDIIDRLMIKRKSKRNIADCKSFINSNRWIDRYDKILTEISSIKK